MAYITFQPSDHFNTKLYTGNGSTQSITGVGFQPDWVWLKQRSGSASSNKLYDAVRGTTKYIASNNTGAEGTESGVTSFDSDWFTLGSAGGTNGNSETYASWNWKANGSGSSNTDGSITSTVSANTTAGFSIVTHTGNGSTATIGHGLGAVPKVIFSRKRAVDNWFTYHHGLGNGKYVLLEATDAQATSSNVWNDTTPTSAVFTKGGPANENAATYISYCFAEKKGFSRFGTYKGNSSASGPFIYCGFKPALFVVKRYDASGEYWNVLDSKRNPENPADDFLYWSENLAEGVKTSKIDFVSNGIKIRGTDGAFNNSAGLYLYLAFAEHPFVSSNGVPATAR